MRLRFLRSTGFILILLIFCLPAPAQTTAFTYQGRLTDGSTAANGIYNMEFSLYGSESGNDLIGTVPSAPVTVTNGIFTVQPDFGAAAFNGSPRYLQIVVGSTPLTPRQPINSVPYAMRSLEATNAATANTATTAGNVTGVVQIANGGTGSSTPNFIDLSTNQTNIGGNKTFTGNLTVNGTLSATLGQDATIVLGTAGITVSNFTYTSVPGLTQTITVSSNSVVYISTQGGVICNSIATTGFSVVDIAISIDGSSPNTISYGINRLFAVNTSTVVSVIENWSIGRTVSLSPGSHTISVSTRLGSGNVAAIVSGDASSVLQGQLTVIILKK
jgi:hypothetical protein